MHLGCYPPKICILLFLLDITVVPREIEENGYAFFFGGGGGGVGGEQRALWSMLIWVVECRIYSCKKKKERH